MQPVVASLGLVIVKTFPVTEKVSTSVDPPELIVILLLLIEYVPEEELVEPLMVRLIVRLLPLNINLMQLVAVQVVPVLELLEGSVQPAVDVAITFHVPETEGVGSVDLLQSDKTKRSSTNFSV